MTQFGQCPACDTKIPAERYFNDSVICECGWNRSLKAHSESAKNIDRICLSLAFFAAVLIGSFIQMVNWDKHFFTIIPLKVQQIAGSANTDQLTEIANICIERKKYVCAEKAYLQAYQKNPQDLVQLEKLGDLQVRQQHMPEAASTYQTYFKQGGKNFEAKYNYAKALAATDQFELAENYFKQVLQAKPDVLQITVTRHYINMLVENNQLKKAKNTIEYFRKKGSNTGLFMEKEYSDIKKKLSQKVAKS